MPAFEQSIDSLDYPFSFRWRSYSGVVPHPITFGADETILDGYPHLPCTVLRQTTNRNAFFTGKKWSTHRRKLFEWYSRKPPPVKLAGRDRTLRKELYTDKADWRRSRPVRTPPKGIPPGWELVSLPDGTFKLRANGYDPRTSLTKFEWVPELKRSLRPTTRKWTRHSKVVPVRAKVNDLLFFRQSGWVDGFSVGAVVKTNSVPATFHYSNPDLLGSVFFLGNFNWFPWSDTGYSVNPITANFNYRDDRASTDHAALLSFWQDEVEILSKTALRRHYVKLKNQKVDLAIFLAEGMKTYKQIVDIATRLGKTLVSLKKLRLSRAFRTLFPTSPKGVANDFLAYKYGIKPLLGDLHGASEHLADYLAKMAPVKSNGHAKQVFRREERIFIGDGTVASDGSRSAHFEIREATIRVKYGTSFSIANKKLRDAASLGFTNPKTVLWEILPFSFVVDWFLPIGEWLSNLSSLDGITVLESYKTVVIFEKRTRYTSLYSFDGALAQSGPSTNVGGSDRGTVGYLIWESSSNVMYRESFFCKREVLDLPELPIPQLKNPISKGNIKTVLALFTQLVSK